MLIAAQQLNQIFPKFVSEAGEMENGRKSCLQHNTDVFYLKRN